MADKTTAIEKSQFISYLIGGPLSSWISVGLTIFILAFTLSRLTYNKILPSKILETPLLWLMLMVIGTIISISSSLMWFWTTYNRTLLLPQAAQRQRERKVAKTVFGISCLISVSMVFILCAELMSYF